MERDGGENVRRGDETRACSDFISTHMRAVSTEGDKDTVYTGEAIQAEA